MRINRHVVILSLLGLYTSGCGTIIHGRYQTIPVSSNPIGAQVRSSSGETCICPCQLTLLRDNEYVLVASLEGYEPQQQSVGKDTSGWFWANIILGGIIGGVIDKSSGSGDKLVPAKIHFDLGAGKVFGAKDTKSKLIEIVQDPNASEDESKAMASNDSVAKLKECANCGGAIGKLEKSYTFEDAIVCATCYSKLKEQEQKDLSSKN